MYCGINDAFLVPEEIGPTCIEPIGESCYDLMMERGHSYIDDIRLLRLMRLLKLRRPACLPCLRASLPACLPACLLAYLPVCSRKLKGRIFLEMSSCSSPDSFFGT